MATLPPRPAVSGRKPAPSPARESSFNRGAVSGTRATRAAASSRAAVVLNGERSAAYPTIAPRPNLPFSFAPEKVWSESELASWAAKMGKTKEWALSIFKYSNFGYWRLQTDLPEDVCPKGSGRLDLSGIPSMTRLPGGFVCARMVTRADGKSALAPVALVLSQSRAGAPRQGVNDLGDAFFVGTVDLSGCSALMGVADSGFQSKPTAVFNLEGSSACVDDFLMHLEAAGDSVSAEGTFRGFLTGDAPVHDLTGKFPNVARRYVIMSDFWGDSDRLVVKVTRRP